MSSYRDGIRLRNGSTQRTRLIQLCLLSGWLIVGSLPTLSSQDPFSEDDDAPAAAPAPTVASSASTLPPNFHPIVRSIREHPPSSMRDYGRALRFLSRIEQWEEIARYLDELASRRMSDADAAAVLEELSSAECLAIRGQGNRFTPEQQSLIARILDGASRFQRAPEVLTNAMAMLRMPRVEDQKRGVIALQSAGREGLAFLVQSIADGTSSPSTAATAVVASFQEDGHEAIKAALRTEDADQRLRLFQLLKGVENRSLLPQYLGAIYSARDLPETRALAMNVVSRILGSSPSADQTRQYTLAQLQQRLSLYSSTKNDVLGNTLPRWEYVNGRLTPVAVSEREARFMDCLQWSDTARRSAVDASSTPTEAVLVELESIGSRQRDIALPLLTSELDSKFSGWNWNASQWSRAWKQAIAYELFHAQRLSVMLMGDRVAADASSLMKDELISAAQSGLPIIRYEATRALLPLLVSGAIHPTERIKANVAEMLALEAQPLVLVVGGSDSLTSHTARLLTPLGYRSEVMQSGRDALQFFEANRPFEMVLIVDRVGDVALTQFVQRMRTHVRGAFVPILILLPEVRESERRILDEIPGLHAGFVPPDEQGLMQLIRESDLGSGQELALLPEERTGFRFMAMEALNQLASQPMEQVPGSIRGLTQAARESLAKDVLASISSQVLGEIGTLASQQELSVRSADSDRQERERRAAAEALVRSFRRHGVHLPMQGVEQIYNAYNNQGRTDVVARESLGAILDEIEIYAKEHGWKMMTADRPATNP